MITAPLTLEVRNGDAQLDLPEGSQVDLESESRRGEIHAELAGATTPREGRAGHGPGDRLSARIGGGGIAVRVSADGDVHLALGPVRAVADRPIAVPDVARATSLGAPVAEPSPREAPTAEAPPSSQTR